MLCIANNIPETKAKPICKAFELLGCAFQLRDDYRDCTIDFGVGQNIAISIAMNHPAEFAKIERSRQQNVPKDWAKKNLPQTLSELDNVFETYLSQVPQIEKRDHLLAVARDLYYM
jgi:geranylgeranyl pyrophosphate synthase